MRISTVALANLHRRRGKALYLASGIAVAIGAVVALWSLNLSMKEEIGSQLDQFGANIVVVPRSASLALDYGGISVSGIAFDTQHLTNEDVAAIGRIPYRKRISIVAPKLLTTVRVDEREVLLAGVDFSSELRLKRWWRITGEKPAKDHDVLMGFDAARVLGAVSVAAEQSPNHSDGHSGTDSDHHSSATDAYRVTRTTVSIGGQDHRVAGVLHPTGGAEDRMILASLHRVQELSDQPQALSVIEVSALCKDCPVDDIVAQINAELPHAEASAIQQAVRTREETVERLTRFSLVVSVVLLLIGGLLIFTTMMGTVVERTREIGVLRAIGFRRNHIVRSLLIEVVLVSLSGGLTGWLAGITASRLALPYFAEGGGTIGFRMNVALAAMLVALVVGVASSLYPAIRASRLDPAEAIRHI